MTPHPKPEENTANNPDQPQGIRVGLDQGQKDPDKIKDRYQRLYEQAPLGYQSLDAEGCFIEVNQAFLDSLGYRREEVIGHWFGDFLAPHMVEAFRERFPRFKASGTTKVEFEMKRKDGTFVTMSIDGRVDYSEDGQFKQTHCVLQDITERKQAVEALRASELKYRALYEQMTQGVLYQRADGILEDVNPAALAMFGLTRDQFLGKTSTDPHWKVITENGEILPPDQHPSMIALRTGRPVIDMRVGVYRPDIDDYTWMNVNAIPQIKPGQTQAERVFVILHNITRQKKAEDDLRASEQRFRNILEKIQLIAVEIDCEGNIQFCNDFLLKLTGWEKDEVLGENWFECFLPKENRALIQEVFNRCINEIEFPIVHENAIQTRDGVHRYIRWNNVILRNPEGHVASIVSLGEDITERMQAAQALRESENRYRHVAESISYWIWEVDANGVYTYASAKVASVLGYTSTEMVGKTPFDLMPPDEAERSEPIFQTIASNKQVIRDLENWNLRKDGQRVCLVTNGVPLLDPDGNLLGYRGVDRDITRRKQAETKLREQIEELQRWHEVTLGRESRVLTIKREVNELLAEAGRPPRYTSVENEQ